MSPASIQARQKQVAAGYPSDLHPLLQALYLPWRWLVWVPFSLLNTFCATMLSVFLTVFSENAAYTCTQWWARLECWCNFVRVRFRGLEHKKEGQAYVVMTNHQSAFDFPVITLPWQSRWVGKAELKKIPIFGWACRATGTVLVDRKNPEAAIASLNAMKPKLKQGISLLIFPEGTRSPDGRLLPLKKGGFHIALELGIPILPVTSNGAGKVWPPRSWRILPGTIEYLIHPPIETKDYGPERLGELMDAVRQALLIGLEAPESDQEPGNQLIAEQSGS